MRSLVEQTLKPATLLKIPDIIEVIRNNIDTNLSLEELLALAGFASKTQRADVQMLLLPGDFNGDGRQGISYWLPNQSKIQELVAQHFNPALLWLTLRKPRNRLDSCGRQHR